MREGGVRGADARERLEQRILQEDLEGSPLHGRRLPARLRNFRPAVDRYVASLGPGQRQVYRELGRPYAEEPAPGGGRVW